MLFPSVVVLATITITLLLAFALGVEQEKCFEHQFGGSSDEYSKGIVWNNNTYVVSGITKSSLYKQINQYFFDYFVAKLNSTNDLIWGVQYTVSLVLISIVAFICSIYF